MKKIVTVTFLLAAVIGCNDSKKDKNICSDTTEILIINRTQNRNIVDSSFINKRTSIEELCDLYNQKTFFGRANDKITNGFLEIFFKTKSNGNHSIDVIYTVYDGLVIRCEDGYFKQDKIIDYILRNVNYK